MELSRLSLKRSLLLSAVITVSLFSNNALAQNSQPTSAATSRQTTSSSSARTTAQTSANTSPNTRSSSSSVTPPSLPAIGTTASTTPNAGPTGLPTLTGTVDTRIPEYPAPTIPPTNNAPFMNHSTLPDGTVFICVGAILGAFGVAIIAWRGIIACLLHRSVERAALAQHVANDKSFPAPPSQFYKFLERDPSPPHGHAAAISGKIHRKSYKGPSPSATASQTNLFFSPTAGPGGSTGIASATNRDSRFLPSGFYASAGPMPGAGHTAGNSISLSTLRPSSRGNVVPSPPESPHVGPTRNYSASSVNLNRPPSGNGRAPSAFLDDLLDDPAAQGHGGQYLPAGGAYRGPDGQFYGGNPSPPGNRY